MGRVFISLLFAFTLAGCQRTDGGFYDRAAKDAAVRAAEDGPFEGYNGVSVGSVRERDRCPQAPSPSAGPCLNVQVTAQLPGRDQAGNKVSGVNVETKWDYFVWLKRHDDDRWTVTHTSYRPAGAAVNGQPYVPSP